MTTILLHIPETQDAELILQLVKRLKLTYWQMENQLSEVDKVLKAIMLVRDFEQEESSFGDALEWQKQQREERTFETD